MTVRLLRFALCAAICLAGLPLAASRPEASAAPPTRRQQAARFLGRRHLRGQSSAAQLTRARAAHSALALSHPAEPGYAPALLNQPWQPLGPAQVSTAAYGNVTGRVSSIAADPSDVTGNTVFVGTTGGGVWKSTDAAASAGAVSFLPLTDDLAAFSGGNLASLSVGALSVQPGGTGVVLAGTGDPNDALDSYYGSGLLRSADGGLTWSLIQHSQDLNVNFLANFYFLGNAFAGFAWSTTTPNLVVAAVSQSEDGLLVGADEVEAEPTAQLSIMGLYYSTDAGQTWFLATITDGPNQVVQRSAIIPGGGGNAATAVVWNPIRKRFYAAVRFHGYYESADGITWTRLANQPGAGLTTTECPTQPNATGSPACPILRGALAVQPTSGDTFALTVDINLLDQGLWQDVCSSAAGACASNTVAFGRQLPSTALEDGNGGITLGDYNLWLAAVPSAADTLLFAGTEDIFRCSLAAGCAFRNTTNTQTCAAALVAPFQHGVDASFAAGLSLMYFGNDSGLWRSTDNVDQTQPPCESDDANHFQNLNGGLGSLAEVDALAEDPSNPAVLLAGLGVNGTVASTFSGETVWPQVLDGYGSYAAIDPANSQNWYAQSSLGVAIDLCSSAPSCNSAGFGTPVVGAAQVSSDVYASPAPSPFLLDPQDSANLILGTCHVWRGPANGVSWSSANLLGDLYPGEGPDCDGNAFIQSLAATGTVSVPAGDTELIYAGMAGVGFNGPEAYAGHLFEAPVSSAAPIPSGWTDLWLSPVANDTRGFNPDQFSISSLIADPHDATGGTIYAAIEAFSTGTYSTGLVYASVNGGATWTNIGSNLPDAPVNCIAIDPNDANTVYLALDTGVYVTTSVSMCATQNCWSVYGTGLPNSPVTELATFTGGGQSLLRAATYGRGIWQVPLITAAATSTAATIAPAALTFASQALQTQSASQSFTLTNTGTIPLVVASAVVSGDFAVVNTCSSPVPTGGNCVAQVTFTPTLTGARTGTLTVYANIAGGQVTATVSGTGILGGAIVLLPAAVNFGSSPIGAATTPAQNVTISNTGGVPVNLQTPTATGDFAIVANTCAASLGANYGCTVALAFTPTASGPRTGVFSISDDAGTQSVALSGIGLSPATDTVSPNALSFAAQMVGTASGAQAVTLANSGDSPLNSIAIQVSGDFQAVNGCGNSLIGHAACAIAVAYAPHQVGAESGTLTIVDMYGRPQTVALTGTGTAPAGISALPTLIDFGAWGVGGSSAAQAVTLTNNGGMPLNSLSFAINGAFSIGANSCSSALAVGANCSIQVVFSPSQSGPASGTLSISSPALSRPFQIALNGNGLGFLFQVDGLSTATITAGQTANYLLQVIPSNGSAAALTFTCAAAPPNSTCTVNPASQAISGGQTYSIAVAIATSAQTSASNAARNGGSALLYAVLVPAGLLVFPYFRKRKLWLAASAVLAILPLGCGVHASGGSGSSPSGGPGSTPSATYSPVITATGPGISQSVTLTTIVE